MTNFEKVRFAKFIGEVFEELKAVQGFEDFLVRRTYSTYHNFEKNLQGEDFGIKTFNGASRVCFVFSEEGFFGDWVLKIPFADCFSFCEREVELFKEAKKVGVDKFLAEAIDLGIYSFGEVEVPLFLMARADTNVGFLTSDEIYGERYCLGEDCSSGRCSCCSRYGCECHETSEVIQSCFENDYSREDLFRYYDFASDNEINDIHFENVGFVENNRIVIIDYAGW